MLTVRRRDSILYGFPDCAQKYSRYAVQKKGEHLNI